MIPGGVQPVENFEEEEQGTQENQETDAEKEWGETSGTLETTAPVNASNCSSKKL